MVAANRSGNDVDLERRIVNYLHQRLPALHEFEVETSSGRVVLRGTVPSTSIRERCVDCCRSVAGVLDVIDRIRVSGALRSKERNLRIVSRRSSGCRSSTSGQPLHPSSEDCVQAR